MLAHKLHGIADSHMKFDQLTRALQAEFGQNAQEIEPRHWAVEVMIDARRSQVVHVLILERTANGRDASRLVLESPIGPLPARHDLEALLRRNASLDIGAISIQDLRDEEEGIVPYLTLRASRLLRTVAEDEVWEMLDKVAHVADTLEKEIFASDMH